MKILNEVEKIFSNGGTHERIKTLETTGKFPLGLYEVLNSLPNNDYHFPNSISSKEGIRKVLKNYLHILLEKGGRSIAEDNIKYYQGIIDKLIDQEEGELLEGKKNKITSNPLKYSEYQDFCYLFKILTQIEIKELIGDLSIYNPEKLEDATILEQKRIEKMQLVGVIDSLNRMFDLRANNGGLSGMFDKKVKTFERMTVVRQKIAGIQLLIEDNTIEKNPNKDFVGPKEEYEIRLDEYFRQLFIVSLDTSSEKQEHYKNLYQKIINYNENTVITLNELGDFVELLYKLEIDIFNTKATGEILTFEEVENIFKKGINNGFLNYILPKVYKTRISELCKKQNEIILNGEDGGLMHEISEILEKDEEDTTYSLKSQLNVETTKIYEGIEVYGIGEKHYRMHYLVKNGKIIAEFKWYDINNIEDYCGRKIMRIMHKNRYANMYLFDGETIGGWFNDVSKLEDGVDGDKVFRASRDGKEMYISLTNGEPIGGEFEGVGILQDGVDGDKVFKAIFKQRNENYISMNKGKTITPYPGYFIVSDIKNMPFGEKYFEYYRITSNAGGILMELNPKAKKINLRTGKEVNLLGLTQFELKRRFNTLLTYLC